MTISVALLGAGAMGRNHARLLERSERARLEAVVDLDRQKAEKLAVEAGARVANLDEAMRCDAAIIATPTDTHVELAHAFLEEGKPLLIEKPLATDVSQVQEMLDRADTDGIPLMCGFVERFNPAVTTALSLIHEPPHHLTAVRHSPPTPRAEVSVVWDLLIHDIDLTFRLSSQAAPRSVHGVRWGPVQGAVAEVADCTLSFPNGMVATLSSSRASQRKIRTFSIAAEASLIEIDLLRADVTVFTHVRQQQLIAQETTYRAETIVDIPFVRHAGEPLALQLDHFLDLIEGVTDPAGERATILAPHAVAAGVAGIVT